MLPLPASSGDLLVDRRLSYAEALAAAGEVAAAAGLVADSLERTPLWAAGWFRLGELHEAAGAAGPARDAFARALALDPADRLGAALRLDLLRRVPLTEAMPSAFVETLFDGYAPGFDASLVGKLDYRGPELVRAALPEGRRFADALDLGCGTGLSGAALRGACARLEGWDISAGMLRLAEAKRVYDRLERADLQDLPAPAAATRDLIVAVDVFLYLGALERITGWVAQALAPGGVFAFTVEASQAGDVVLGPERRYRHSSGYVGALLERAGFVRTTLRPAVLRQDRGQPVAGLVVTATAPEARRASEGEAMAETA